jgi:hypothetical protein
MSYVEVDVTTNAADLEQRAYAVIQSVYPDFDPNAGGLATILVQAIALMAETRAIDSAQMPARAFRYFGEDFLGISRSEGSPARILTTWTVTDDAGHTIPEGTFVTVDNVDFQVAADVTVPPGSTTTADGEVELIALEDGSDGNGLGSVVVLNDALAWVNTITPEGLSGGGADAQDDEDYQDDLSERLQLLGDRLILPIDFEIAAKDVEGVGRAAVLDTYNPDDGTTGNERYVTVAVATDEGQAPSPAVLSAVDTYLQSRREVNFVIRVIGPTLTGNDVDVSFEFATLEDYDPQGVKANAQQAVRDYLNPATWGVPAGADSDRWLNTRVVRLNKVIQAIENTPGVDYAENVLVNGSASNFLLTGAAPLPVAGDIEGTAL